MAHTPAAVAVEAAPLVIPQGADWSVPWLFAEGSPAGLPAGWPGSWSARMTIRDGYGGDRLAHFTTAPGGGLQLTTLSVGTPSTVPGVPDGGTVGLITLTVDDTTSAAWTWAEQTGVFDLELVSGARVVRAVEGKITLSAEVTTDA